MIWLCLATYALIIGGYAFFVPPAIEIRIIDAYASVEPYDNGEEARNLPIIVPLDSPYLINH